MKTTKEAKIEYDETGLTIDVSGVGIIPVSEESEKHIIDQIEKAPK